MIKFYKCTFINSRFVDQYSPGGIHLNHFNDTPLTRYHKTENNVKGMAFSVDCEHSLIFPCERVSDCAAAAY